MWAPARRLTAARIGLHGPARRSPPRRCSISTWPTPARATRSTPPWTPISSAPTCKASVRPHPSTSPKAPRAIARNTCSAPTSAANSNPAPRCPRIPSDLAIVVADGLSAAAAQSHAPAVLAALLPALHQWRIAPIVIARHGRVALGDAIARQRAATSVLILLGERPGLSAPDSLGAYITWNPTRIHHRRRPQLHLQHPPRGTAARRSRPSHLVAAGTHARTRLLRRRPEGRVRRRRCERCCSANGGSPKRLNGLLRCGRKARGVDPACPLESDRHRRQPKGHRTAPFSVEGII